MKDIITAGLYRSLRSDYPNNIFPKVYCKKTELGDGDTFFSVQQIATTIYTYWKQSQQIATLLKKSSLKATSQAIHQFVYTHFQYKADEQEQQLRSPACSWRVRESGIDCKSYSIVVGSILMALDISFYIRQIKQPFFYPDQFTHVYIVVPIDQVNNNLQKGYYVIDGTIPTMNETAFVEYKDVLVMKHIGLNGVVRVKNPIGLGNGIPNTYTPPFGTNSGTYSDTEGNTYGAKPSKFDKVIGRVNQVGGTLKNLIETFGPVVGIKKYNEEAQKQGAPVLPSNIQTQEQINDYVRSLSNQANGEQQMQMMMAIMTAMLSNNKNKSDDTILIIGGIGIAVVAVLFMMNQKK
jgi:hypothetical protein